MAAKMRAKINRRKLNELNIIEICEEILNPPVPRALRLTGILMGGVVIFYERKVKLLYDDVNRFLVELKKARKVKSVPDPTLLPKGKSQAKLGQVENGRRQLCFHGQQPDKTELQKMLLLEKHLNRCVDARKIGNWKSVLRECDAAMVAGADSSLQITACKAEASLKLHKLEDADSILSRINELEAYPTSCLQTKFFGMLSEAYVLYVQAQVDMAFGRFENAVAAAGKAGLVDYSNIEIAMLLNNVKLVTRARSRGKDLFDSGRFAEACTAYGEGLKYDLSNSLLFCNRAVCWSKLGLWEKSVEDCNQALKFQPNYTKALLRRAVSNAKLERWAEAVRDYEILRREFPGDNDVAESLFHAQVALKKLRQGEAHNAKCSNKVHEEVSIVDCFKDAISSPGGMWRRAQQ